MATPAGATHGGGGHLDPAFDGDGVATASIGGGRERGNAMALQPDGKIVVAGQATLPGGGTGFGVVRFNPDGTLDGSFNDGGTVATAVGSGIAQAVAVQDDGKIVVAGYSFQSGSDWDFTVARYDANGALDPGFGADGTGLQRVAVSAGKDVALDVAIDADDNIVVAGWVESSTIDTQNDLAVVRLDSRGVPDASFDGDGVKTIDVGGSAAAEAVTLQGDGKIVLAGSAVIEVSHDMVFARLNADGTPDAGFGTEGITIKSPSMGGDLARDVAIQGDGKIVAAGSVDGDLAVVRLTASGASDLSFGKSGTVIAAINTGSSAHGVAVQADGGIVAAGSTFVNVDTNAYDIAVAAFTADGAPDASFGTNGVATGGIAPHDAAHGVAVQDDGKFVVGGFSGDPELGSLSFMAARFTAPIAATTGPGNIVFTSTADGGDRDIYVMAEDGTGRTQLTANDVDDSFPDWSPDASKIVFESNRADPGAPEGELAMATTGPIGNIDTDETDELVEVLETGGAKDYFVGCDIVALAPSDDDDDKTECLLYTYDDNDTFSVMGVATTLAGFKEALTVFDDVDGDYNDDPAAASVFNLVDEAPPDDLDIYVMNPDGSNAVNLTLETDHAGYDGVAAWSPDGSTIAFVSDHGGEGRNVWLMNADGTEKRQLTTTPLGGGSYGRPSWAPGSDQLVIHRGDSELYAVSATDGTETPLTADGFVNQDAAWSPDGRHIAYMSDRRDGNGPQIYVLDIDSKATRKLTVSNASESIPTFSPDGRYVAYSSAPFGDEEIYVSDVGGGLMKPAQLTSSAGSDARPAWADNLDLVALSTTVEASPAVVPVEHIPMQNSPDVEAAPLTLGSVSVAPLTLGSVSVAPLTLGSVSVAPLTLGSVSVAPSSGIASALSIPLSTIPPAAVWEEILAGDFPGNEQFQGPLASITLLQVLQNPTTLARFQERAIAEFDFSRSPLAHLSIYGLLLDGVTLADIDWPAITCDFFADQGHGPCGETLWDSGSGKDGFDAGLATVELAGLNPALLRIYAVPMGDITMAAGTPLLTRGLAHLRLASGRIGFVRDGDLNTTVRDAVFDCSTVTCDGNLTLAKAQETQGGIKADATIGHLGAAIDHLTLGEVVTLFAPPDMRHLGEFPLDDLGIAGYHGPGSGYHTQRLELTYAPVGQAEVVNPIIDLELPPGSPYFPGSGAVSVGGGAGTSIDPVMTGDVATFRPNITVPAGQVLTLGLDIFPGTDVGPRSVPSARVRSAGIDQVARNRGVFTAIPNQHFAGSELSPATPIEPEELNVLHIAGKDDHKLLSLAAPVPGSTIQIFVDHLTFDVDVALYGTAPPQPVRPYGPTPRVTPIPDEGAPLFQAGAAVAPDSQQDFPFLFHDLPVTAVGNQRGTTSEHLQAVVPAGSDVDRYLLQLSGFLGDHGPDAFTVRYRIIPPPNLDPAPARTFADITASSVCGDLPSVLPKGTKSLVIVPCDRLVDAFGETAVEPLMTKLTDYAAHPKVEGVVLPVDRAPTVQNAYAAWDLEPHEPERANDVVREVLKVVDGVVGGRRAQIDYVTLVGDDHILPFARTLDLTTLGNEAGFAGEAQIDGNTNSLVGSFAHRYLLTDDAYGDWEPEQWGGWPFYLADAAVGRVASTPTDGVLTLGNFLTHNGELDPQTSYTAGYEFMTDFAHEVDGVLQTLAGSGTADINETWSRADALAGIGGSGISSVNAHADPSGMLPANGLPLLTAADIDDTLDLTAKLLFSMACHGGLNRPDVSLAMPPSTPQEMDFPQVTHRRGAAGYAGNTGYGLGLTDGIGLSEQVYLDFARKLGSMATGQSLTFSKHEFLANEPLDNAWAAKSLQSAVLYGLPQYTIAGVTPTTAPTSSRLLVTDPATGLPAEVVEFSNSFDRETTPKGDYYTVAGETTRVVGRAVQPLATEEVHPEGTDAVITDLSTSTAPDGDGFDPLVVQSALSSSGALPVAESPDMISNSEFASVREYQTPDGSRARLSLVAGQFAGRDVVDGEVVGSQNLVDSATVAVLNNGPGDGHRPVITASEGVVIPTGTGGNIASFSVEAHDIDASGERRPVLGGLVLAQDSTGGLWHRAVLQPSANDPYTLTGGIPNITGTDPELRFFVQVWDGQLVGRTTLKGLFDRTVLSSPTSDGEVTVTVDGTPSGGFYPSSTTVTVEPGTGVEWRLDGGDWQAYEEPVPVTGDGIHRFDHRTATGSGAVYVPIDATPPDVVQLAASRTVYALGQVVPTSQVVGCRDAASGIAQCEISQSTIDTSSVGTGKTASFTVTALDGAGHQTVREIVFTYSVAYLFDGFYNPVRNEPTVNEVKAGRTVPLKFRLYDANGNEVTSVASATVMSVELTDCTSGSSDTNQVEETATDSSNTLRYDSDTGQYVYNWVTDRKWSGCRQMTLRLHGDGRSHTALFSFAK